MSPEMPASPSSDPRPRPAGNGDSSGGDRPRGRRRSGRGGRGRSGSGGSGEGQAQGQTQGQTTGQAQGQGRGERRGEPRGERRGEARADNRNRGGRRSGDVPTPGGEAKTDRPRGDRGGRGEGGGGRPAGRGGAGEAAKAQAQNQAQQQEAARARRREAERESEPTPSLQDWSFEHLGYTAWMAHAQILPIRDPKRALRSYIVDIHAGEDAVNPRLWSEIAPFLNLETTGPGPEAGAKALAEMFRALAAEAGLRPAADYLAEHPPAEVPVSSPVQAALDTAIPLEPDTDQEDIDIMNEGRKGAPLPPRG